MNKNELVQLIATETGKVVTDATVKLWAEMARLKVAGDHEWRRLKYFDTLTTVANTKDYILPDRLGGAFKPPIDKLLDLRGQVDTDRPINIVFPEEFMETIYQKELEVACIRNLPGSPGSSLSPGQMEIRLSLTPTSAKILDVLLKLVPAADSLDFVSLNNHAVFYWAGLAFAYSKAQRAEDQGGFQNAASMYVNEMKRAVETDYPSPEEEGRILPVQRWLDFRSQTVTISGGR